MKIILFAVSEINLLEARQNTLSIINVLEEINSFAFPAVAPKLSICFIAQKEDGDADLTDASIKIKLGDEIIVSQQLQIPFHGRPQVRSIAEIQGLIIGAPGVLAFQLMIDDQIVADWVIQANHIGQPQVSPVAT